MIWSVLSCLRDLLLVLFPSACPRAALSDPEREIYPLGRAAVRFVKLGEKWKDVRDVDVGIVLLATPGSNNCY